MNLAIIPARGGSVRIPRKNIRPFMGKPMICHAIEVAQLSNCFQRIIVSTDDDEVERVARASNGVYYVYRRDGPDDGTKGTQEVARDLLASPWGDLAHFACVIYPCVPLLRPSDLVAGMWALHGHDFAMSVDSLGNDAGAFYWGRYRAFVNRIPLGPTTAKVTLPPSRCCDINDEDDWLRAESLYTALRRAP